MAGQNKMKTREDLVKEIKDCGQSIIDNAESILGDERYLIKVAVQFVVQRNSDSMATIVTSKEFIPEAVIEDLSKESKTKKSPAKKTTKTKKKGDK